MSNDAHCVVSNESRPSKADARQDCSARGLIWPSAQCQSTTTFCSLCLAPDRPESKETKATGFHLSLSVWPVVNEE